MTQNFDAFIKHYNDNNVRTTGFISFINQKLVDNILSEFFKNGEKVTITVKTRRKHRSLPQNSLIHAYMTIIANESGNTLETVKSVLKRLFLTRDVIDKNGDVVFNPKTGEVLTYVQDTSELSTIEMAAFTEEIRMWALDFGIYLPLPKENHELKLR